MASLYFYFSLPSNMYNLFFTGPIQTAKTYGVQRVCSGNIRHATGKPLVCKASNRNDICFILPPMAKRRGPKP